MAFRRRFAPGTLERSVRRWGPRFPLRPGFKRKQFSHYYSALGGAEGGMDETGATLKEVIIFEHEDWGPNAGLAGQIGVRGVSLDMSIGLSILPKNAAYVTEDWYFTWALVKCDTDQTYTSIDNALAQTSAIRWGTQGFVTATSTSGSGSFTYHTSWMKRLRCRISSMKEDEEVRLLAQIAFGCSGSVDDVTLLSTARIRYEIP